MHRRIKHEEALELTEYEEFQVQEYADACAISFDDALKNLVLDGIALHKRNAAGRGLAKVYEMPRKKT